jgi:hypothetical protein
MVVALPCRVFHTKSRSLPQHIQVKDFRGMLIFSKTDQHLLKKVFQELGQQQQKRLHDGREIAAGQGNSKLILEVDRDTSFLEEFSHNVLLFGFGLRNNTNTMMKGISIKTTQVSSFLRYQDIWQLTDQHRESDAIQITVKNGLRQQLGDEAEPGETGQDAQGARLHGEQSGKRHQSIGVAGGQRQNHRGDDTGKGRIRPSIRMRLGPKIA